jgi:N-acetylmuramic acid 6-phosphate etherase
MLERLTTEQRNPTSESIDQLSAVEICELINREDAKVASAVQCEIGHIAAAVDEVVAAIRHGGRLIYLGAGTSGRLGVLDAAECPPTFNTDPNQVVGLIAGGQGALVKAVEGAEDAPEAGSRDLRDIGLTSTDVVVGIATSGRTPYVLGGLAYARELGCTTVGISCNLASELSSVVHIMIAPVVGPEVISGSTRMKAGTATKLVLNMLTTATMVRLGKTYGNLMVDLRATNTKLVHRSRRIVSTLTGVDETEADVLLSRCDGEVKTAIVAHVNNVDAGEARRQLNAVSGHLRAAIDSKGELDEGDRRV